MRGPCKTRSRVAEFVADCFSNYMVLGSGHDLFRGGGVVFTNAIRGAWPRRAHEERFPLLRVNDGACIQRNGAHHLSLEK